MMWLYLALVMPKINQFVETAKRGYRVDRREIAYLKFILEAYDGLAVVSTLDSEAGLLVLHIAPGCESDVEMIMQDLRRDIMLEPFELKIDE
jgi:hypothetical protein